MEPVEIQSLVDQATAEIPALDSVAVEPVVEEKETKEVIVEERGNKPIRWASSFIDKIREKNAKREETRLAKEEQKNIEYAEKLIEKEIEKARRESVKAAKEQAKAEEKATKEVEKQQNKAINEAAREAKKEEIKGKLVIFKHNLGAKKAKLVENTALRMVGLVDNISTKVDKKKKSAVAKKTEKRAAKKSAADKKAQVKKDKEALKKSVEKVVLSENAMSLTGSSNPYEIYSQLPEEQQREIINHLMESLAFLQEQNKASVTKVQEAEVKLEEAKNVILEQNNKIEKIVEEKVETAEVQVEEPTVIEPIEITPDVPSLTEEVVVEETVSVPVEESVVETVSEEPVVEEIIEPAVEVTVEETVIEDKPKISTDVERAQHILEHVQSGNYNLDQAIGREQADLVYEKIEAEKAEWEKARQELIDKNRENSEEAKQKQAEIAEELFKKEKEEAIDRYRSEGMSYKQAIEKWNLDQEQKAAEAETYAQTKLEETQDDFIDIVRKKTDYSIDEAVNEWNVRQEEESRKIR